MVDARSEPEYEPRAHTTTRRSMVTLAAAGLVRSVRTLTLMLGSKPGMLSLSLTFHCVYVAHGSRAAPAEF